MSSHSRSLSLRATPRAFEKPRVDSRLTSYAWYWRSNSWAYDVTREGFMSSGQHYLDLTLRSIRTLHTS